MRTSKMQYSISPISSHPTSQSWAHELMLCGFAKVRYFSADCTEDVRGAAELFVRRPKGMQWLALRI